MAASVSVVIPAYNEGPRVGQVVRAAVVAECAAEAQFDVEDDEAG